MRGNKYKNGFTLIEILIVVGIIAVLTSMVIGIARRIDNQGKERLVEDTFVIITAALMKFGDYGYNYNADYSGFKFPLDCNDFGPAGLVSTLQSGLNAVQVTGDGIIPVSNHNESYSGSEAMYLLLSQVPECRKTLERIDESLVTNKGKNKNDMDIIVGGRRYPLMRVIDPWGKTVRYDYYNEREADPVVRDRGRRTFPVLTSAGPDGKFGTVDDISSK